MENQEGLYQLFIEELEDMYSGEQQIVDSLPKLINLASSKDLVEALTKHLKETKDQVKRIERIFSILGLTTKSITCKAMEGLIKEAEELVGNRNKSPTTDAAIICAAQKVEHYEIASYGTLRCFAEQLDLDSEIPDLLEKSINEEGAADKTLTKIAKGSIFFGGVNQKAAEVGTPSGRK